MELLQVEIDKKWESYRQKKLEVQKLVQAKIKQFTDRWVAEVRDATKSGPRKF